MTTFKNENFQDVFDQFLRIKQSSFSNEDLLLQCVTLLRNEIDHYDWVGFYILDQERQFLNLGPFAGKPTEHTQIAVGKGVCGQVAISGKPMIVQDVTKQDNYIACSMDVQSEIVVPIMKQGIMVAEIDIDSHAYAPFTEEDERFLSLIAAEISSCF